MSGYQRAVLWMGLILVLLNVVYGPIGKDLKTILFGAPAKGGKKNPPQPILPFIPTLPNIPIIPGLPISTPNQTQV